VDWTGFEDEWRNEAARALAALTSANPGERLYAAAFHLFYSDGSQILSPALAANVESAVRMEDWGSTRFVPPEWRWDVIDAASAAMASRYEMLTKELVASPDPNAFLLEHDRAMARVCRSLTASARRGAIHPSLPPDFVVAVIEGQRGEDEMRALVRESVDPHVLAALPDLGAMA
jgi:hypothetical protein